MLNASEEIRFGIDLVEDATRRAELCDWLTHSVRPMFEQQGRTHPLAARPVHGGDGPASQADSRDARRGGFEARARSRGQPRK
ncbi:hypothetical protein DSM21852_08470 [Methylocystis bryophila]|nr:hypothetical protein DSM21852_08470 [Methylocystis bryophila]